MKIKKLLCILVGILLIGTLGYFVEPREDFSFDVDSLDSFISSEDDSIGGNDSSSTGDSGGGSVDIFDSQCFACYGSGDCGSCDGSGVDYNLVAGTTEWLAQNCLSCGGTGNCSFCYGSGK